MSEPVIAGKKSIQVSVEAGKTYHWCACGRSQGQPFCDGSHRGTEFRPLTWQAAETKQLWLCQCKRTGAPPLCDGTHKTLA
jgi:CDGSH iron-sulfur domain-containing protein 3